MNETDRLIELFKDFPSIGPRQAKRFVYFLLTRNEAYVKELSRLIIQVRGNVKTCAMCFRFYQNGNSTLCPTCADEHRDKTLLMVISHDVDFENVEKTGNYTGFYFVL